MKVRLLKIWKDPVWSKVISVLIVFVGTLTSNVISSWTKGTQFVNAFYSFWVYEIPLWSYALLTIIVIIGVSLIGHFVENKRSKFQYEEATHQLDANLFNRIRNELLPNDGSILWLQNANFARSFELNKLDQLDYFENEANKADFEFLNPDMEEVLLQLVAAIRSFTCEIGAYTFPAHRDGWQTVAPEWETQNHNRFWNVVNSLNYKAIMIHTKYQQLIRLGRRQLKI